MIIGFVIILLNCLPNGQYCDPQVYGVDDGTIYSNESECLSKVDYYNSYFNPNGQLTCEAVQRD